MFIICLYKFSRTLPRGPLWKNHTRESISFDRQDGRIIGQISVVPLQGAHHGTKRIVLLPMIDFDELYATRENGRNQYTVYKIFRCIIVNYVKLYMLATCERRVCPNFGQLSMISR